MNKKQKTCAFYASDYHFEMISLPYINKKIEENKEIIILTENNLEQTIKTLISKMNLKEEKKKKIFEIDWKNKKEEKLLHLEEEKEIIIFVKGKENYINNINKNIEKWTEKRNNVKIIDCYDMEEIGEKLDTIIEQYKMVLNTAGEKEISKI